MKIFMRKKLSETIKNRCRCCFYIQKRNILLCPLSTLWRSLRQKYNAMKRVSIRFHKSSLVKHDKFFKRERICHFLKLISSPFKSKKKKRREKWIVKWSRPSLVWQRFDTQSFDTTTTTATNEDNGKKAKKLKLHALNFHISTEAHIHTHQRELCRCSSHSFSTKNHLIVDHTKIYISSK